MTYDVHLMVGIPASGKTTFVKQEIERLEADGVTCAHISRDIVRFSMLEDNDEYFDKENEVFNEFVRQVNESIALGIENVFIDATHINPASRRKVLSKIVHDKSTRLIVDVFDAPLYEAANRNFLRKGRERVPYDALKNMYYNFSYPAMEEFARMNFYNFSEVKIIDRH